MPCCSPRHLPCGLSTSFREACPRTAASWNVSAAMKKVAPGSPLSFGRLKPANHPRELAPGLRRPLGTQTHSGGDGAQPQRQLAIRQHRATSSQATRNPQARCPNSPRVPHGKTRTGQEAKSHRPRARARAAWALARLRPRPRLLERVPCRHQPPLVVPFFPPVALLASPGAPLARLLPPRTTAAAAPARPLRALPRQVPLFPRSPLYIKGIQPSNGRAVCWLDSRVSVVDATSRL